MKLLALENIAQVSEPVWNKVEGKGWEEINITWYVEETRGKRKTLLREQ